uniref:Uncharacterized protein n=1 Tax=Megaselia scalaris TaxID=36166 RepID=T1GG14_MEGSC
YALDFLSINKHTGQNNLDVVVSHPFCILGISYMIIDGQKSYLHYLPTDVQDNEVLEYGNGRQGPFVEWILGLLGPAWRPTTPKPQTEEGFKPESVLKLKVLYIPLLTTFNNHSKHFKKQQKPGVEASF